MKQRRVLEVAHRIFPKAAADARLRMLVLKLTRQSGAPANSAVGAGHVRDGGAGRGGFEAIGLRDHVGDLIAAPTVPLNSDRVLIHETLIDDGLNSRQHAFHGALSGIAGRVNDVRHENQVAVADIVGRIDRSAWPGITKRVQTLREAFVDVYVHWLFLFWFEFVYL